MDDKFVDQHDWVCNITLLEKLLNSSEETTLVFGVTSNQKEFMHLFDKVILLQCKSKTFIKRLTERQDNAFGKDPSVQQQVLGWYEEFEKDLIDEGATVVNTEGSTEQTIKKILNEI